MSAPDRTDDPFTRAATLQRADEGELAHAAPHSQRLLPLALDSVVVVPCYNEEARLPRAEIRDYFLGRAGTGVLFVDDGSQDGTAETLEALCNDIGPRAAMLRLPLNAGKAEAVRRGMQAAMASRPRFLAFWDADLATPLALIEAFRGVLEERDHLLVVLGARVKLLGFDVERRATRHFSGRIFATAASIVLRIPVYDTQCGAKMFRMSPEAAQAFSEPFMSRWIFDVEILARLLVSRRRGGAERPEACMFEYPLPRWKDVRGSKLSIADYGRAAIDLTRIWWRYRSA